MADPGVMKALDAQLDLISWWSSQKGRAVAEGFIESTRRQGSAHGDMFTRSDNGPRFAGIEANRLNQAPTYFVTSEMADTIAWASRTWPGKKLNVDDLPGALGFVYLEKPIVVVDVKGRTIIVKAMSWGPVGDPKWFEEQPAMAFAFGAPVSGTSVVFYSDITDVRDEAYEELMEQHRAGWQPMLSMFHVGQWIFGDDPIPVAGEVVEPEGGADVPLSMHTWMLAFWTIIQQEIVVMPRAQLPRGLMRRAKRIAQAPEFGDVRVVTLRRSRSAHRDDFDHEPEERFWSHRWVVRGHWRRLHQGTDEECLTWVMEHVKGPDWLPLIIKDEVFKVSR